MKPADQDQIASYLPGALVKNERGDELGIIICRDDPHELYWKVLTSDGVKTWSEHNLQRVENESTDNANRKRVV